jgi:hypothetical protein
MIWKNKIPSILSKFREVLLKVYSKIIRVLLKFKRGLLRFLGFLILGLPYVMIHGILALIGFRIFILFVIMKKPVLDPTIRLISYGLVFMATFALLGFAYATAIKDKKVKFLKYKDLLYFSERLFHGVLIFTKAVIFFWFMNYITGSDIPAYLSNATWFRYVKYLFYALSIVIYWELLEAAKYFACGLKQFIKMLEDRLVTRKEN